MTIRPLHDRVLVKRLDEEDKTAGGIIIPDTAKEKPMEGEIVAVSRKGMLPKSHFRGVAYEDYKKLAKPIAEKYGGTYRARGGKLDVRETDLWEPTRIVIIEFPDVESAQAFVDSEEYAPVKPMRQNNAQCTLFIVEGD